MRQILIHEPRKTMDFQEALVTMKQASLEKKDIVVDSKNLLAVPDGDDVALNFPEEEGGEAHRFGINEWAHGQISEKTKIPKPYYNKMREAGKVDLLADNINAWIQNGGARMVRTQRGIVRALVSNKFLRIDNGFVAGIAYNRFKAAGLDMHDPNVVKRCHISDTRMYIQVNVPYQFADIKDGDRVVQGLILSNSEVGASAFTAEPFLYRVICKNGLIAPHALTRIHLGSRNDIGLMSETTNDLERQLLESKVTDIINSVFDEKIFHAWVEQLRETTEVTLPVPTVALNNTMEMFNIPDGLRENILDVMIREGDNTQYGLVNALTETARDLPSFEDMVTIERVAGDISVMKEQEFLKKLATV